jgi:uncharacterized protein YcnI
VADARRALTRSLVLVLALAALAAAPAASAHGTLAPVSAGAGATQRFELTVPNARLDADVVKVTLELPPGAALESAEAAQPRWGVSSQEGVVTWSGGPIARGSVDTFAFTARLPLEAGVVEFGVRETWDDGATPPPFPIAVTLTDAPGAGDSDATLSVAALVVALVALAAATAALVVALGARRPPG